jgi:peptidoglycan hydrolase-like protein with peptidoglycan-binding domain
MRSLLVLLFSVFFCASLHAEVLTVDSLVGLKALGFSDSEIKEQIIQSGHTVNLSDVDLVALKNAGFSEALINFIRHPEETVHKTDNQPAGIGQDRLQPISKTQDGSPGSGSPQTPHPINAPAEEPPENTQSPSVTPDIPKVVFSEQVLLIQQHLNQLGYNAGVEDGIMGSKTSAAIRNFQANSGITVDGQPSAQLLVLLAQQVRQDGGRVQRYQNVHQQLIGGWQTLYQGNYGYPTQMYLDLLDDGTFASSSTSSMGYAEGSGTYQVQGNTLILRNEYGQVENYTFRVQGQQLIVHMPQVGAEVVFTRYE